MNPTSLSGFEFSAAATSAATASSQPDSADHLQRLAAMTQSYLQGVGKEDPDGSTPSAEALYSGAYMPGYGAWPNYYQQFGQPLAPAAAFGAWPAQCYAPPGWPNYAQTKKGRQTYQRYQTSVLESKFQLSSYVSKKQREELRLQTNLTDRQIKIWFQNRRMKAKKEKHRLDEGGEHAPLLPANPPKGHEDEEKKWQQQCMGGGPLGAPSGASQWPGMGQTPSYPSHPQYPLMQPQIQ